MSRVKEEFYEHQQREQEWEEEQQAYTEAERQAIAALILWQSGLVQQ